ncbi:MAG: tetratricopeptide repeat protein [Acidimicrobiia bacterium]
MDDADVWVDEGVVDEAVDAVGRANGRTGRPSSAGRSRPGAATGPRPASTTAPDKGATRSRRLPAAIAAVEDELGRAAGAGPALKLGQRLAEATRAYERDRFPEARTLLGPVAKRAPGVPAVRELFGLTLYRLGQYRAAARELDAFRALTGSTEQNPVLADCERALGHWDRVEELWSELKAASPGAAVVAEGRIVAAGGLADRGRIDDAIRLLEAGTRAPRRMQAHHLRLFYALADLRERAGDIPAARQLFSRVKEADPDFADTASRLRALG